MTDERLAQLLGTTPNAVSWRLAAGEAGFRARLEQALNVPPGSLRFSAARGDEVMQAVRSAAAGALHKRLNEARPELNSFLEQAASGAEDALGGRVLTAQELAIIGQRIALSALAAVLIEGNATEGNANGAGCAAVKR